MLSGERQLPPVAGREAAEVELHAMEPKERMTGNDKKTATKARERLWPFVTCYQYIQPIRSVKEFFLVAEAAIISASSNSTDGVDSASPDQVMGKNSQFGYTRSCI